MKSAVLAVTPTLNEEPARLDRLCRQVEALQKRGLLESLTIASVMHPNLYPYPSSYYQRLRFGLTHQHREQLSALLRNRLSFGRVHMLSIPSSERLSLTEKLSDFAVQRRADVLVVNQPKPKDWLDQMFSRVAESTAFSAGLPVLVLSSGHEPPPAGSEPKILLGVDPRAAPSMAELEQLITAAKLTGAEVHLVHVTTQCRPLTDAFGECTPAGITMRKLRCIEAHLLARGVRSRPVMLAGGESVAASLERYADDHQVMLSSVTSPARPFLRKFLLGSTARKLLKISKRPVFVLREKNKTVPNRNMVPVPRTGELLKMLSPHSQAA